MKKLGLFTSAVLAAATLTDASPALAAQCVPGGVGLITLGTGDSPTVYIDDRGITNGTWIYLESNTVTDLQRGGTTLAGTETDSCNDSDSPDTLVF